MMVIFRDLSLFRCHIRYTFHLIGNRKYSKIDGIKKFGDIPTIQRISVLGNVRDMLMAASTAKNIHKIIDDRHKQLGPILRETLGPNEMVFVNSPDIIREVFLQEGQYPVHIIPESWQIYNQIHNCKRGLFFMDGEEWLNTRKIMNSILLRCNLSYVKEITDEVTKTFIKNITCGQDFSNVTKINNLIDLLYRWSIEVIVALMYGKTDIIKDPLIHSQITKFSKTVKAIFETSSELIPPMSPSLAYQLNSYKWKKMEKSITSTLILAHDLVDNMLQYRHAQKTQNIHGFLNDMEKCKMSVNYIKRIFTDLIIAAGDTTAYSTQWALYLISKNTNLQPLVRNDIRLEGNNYDSQLIRGIVKEALRLYPVATFIGRIFNDDVQIGGYMIPKNIVVLASSYSVGRDSANYTYPNNFIPHRWVRDSEGNYKYVKKNAMIPYALGSRSCVGQKIANLQMFCLLSQVFKDFQVGLLNELPTESTMQMIIVPTRAIQIGIKRLP